MAPADPEPISLRPAAAQDVPLISTLGAHIFGTTFGHSVTPEQLQTYLDESYSIEATSKDITDPNKDMVIAVNQNDDIVGFALLTRGTTEPCVAHIDNTIELQRIYVHPDHHGKGIGKTLALKLEDMAKQQGFKHMWLGVWEENHKAQKVYEKLGYRIVGDHDFIIGGDVQRDHIMIKDL